MSSPNASSCATDWIPAVQGFGITATRSVTPSGITLSDRVPKASAPTIRTMGIESTVASRLPSTDAATWVRTCANAEPTTRRPVRIPLRTSALHTAERHALDNLLRGNKVQQENRQHRHERGRHLEIEDRAVAPYEPVESELNGPVVRVREVD